MSNECIICVARVDRIIFLITVIFRNSEQVRKIFFEYVRYSGLYKILFIMSLDLCFNQLYRFRGEFGLTVRGKVRTWSQSDKAGTHTLYLGVLGFANAYITKGEGKQVGRFILFP